jgi:hypothetical protein
MPPSDKRAACSALRTLSLSFADFERERSADEIYSHLKRSQIKAIGIRHVIFGRHARFQTAAEVTSVPITLDTRASTRVPSLPSENDRSS